MIAGTYETTVEARAIDPEFRATALARFDRTCPISGIDHLRLLDIAHVPDKTLSDRFELSGNLEEEVEKQSKTKVIKRVLDEELI